MMMNPRTSRYPITLAILMLLFGFLVMAHAQELYNLDPSSASAGDQVTLVSYDDVRGSCYLRSASGQTYFLENEEVVDDLTRTFVIPNAPAGSYEVYCGDGIDNPRTFIGTFTVLARGADQTGGLQQPEQYFAQRRAGTAPISTTINRVGNETVATLRFENPATNQAILLVARGPDDSTVRRYVQSVQRVYFAVIPTGNFRLSSGSSSPGPSTATAPDLTVHLRVRSAGVAAAGWTNYTTLFAIDPEIQRDEKHDYVSTTSQSASAAVMVSNGRVSLNLTRVEPIGFSMQVSQTGNSPTWLKNSISPSEGSYVARVVGQQTGSNRYVLMGTFDDYVCPPEDPGCPDDQPLAGGVLYGRMANARVLNVRTGPGTDWGIITQLLEGDPIAVAGRNSDGTWVRLHTDEPRWINVRYSTITDVFGLPVSNDQGVAPNTELPLDVWRSGDVRDVYGNAWLFWNTTQHSYGLTVQTEFPTTVYVVYGSDAQSLYFDRSTTYREFSVVGRNDYPYSLLLRMNEGALGGYSILLTRLN